MVEGVSNSNNVNNTRQNYNITKGAATAAALYYGGYAANEYSSSRTLGAVLLSRNKSDLELNDVNLKGLKDADMPSSSKNELMSKYENLGKKLEVEKATLEKAYSKSARFKSAFKPFAISVAVAAGIGLVVDLVKNHEAKKAEKAEKA